MFWHDLAALLGGRTVQEWQEVMQSPEFSRWIAWARIRGMFGLTQEKPAPKRASVGQIKKQIELLEQAFGVKAG